MMNLRAKFEVCILGLSRDISGVPKFEKKVTRPRPRPLFHNFFYFFWFSIPYGQSACKIWALYLQPFPRYYGVPKFEKLVTWPRSRPLLTNFAFFWFGIPYDQSARKIW